MKDIEATDAFFAQFGSAPAQDESPSATASISPQSTSVAQMECTAPIVPRETVKLNAPLRHDIAPSNKRTPMPQTRDLPISPTRLPNSPASQARKSLLERAGVPLLVMGFFLSLASFIWLYPFGQGMRPHGQTAGAQPRNHAKNIQDVRVGERVVASNPELQGKTPPEEIVQPKWRCVDLVMDRGTAGNSRITLLRSLAWIEDEGAWCGREIDLSMPEMSAEGPARIVAIGPCPNIKPGRGRVVTGTFAHESGEVLDIRVTGLADPIGVTAQHPFWSENRQEFVPAGELQVGEQLRTVSGDARVIGIQRRAGVHRCYNLEVDGEHTYLVSPLGILVHNASAGTNQGPRIHVTYTKTNPKTGQVYSGRASGFGRPENIVRRRDSSHHKTGEGFGPAQLDKFSTNRSAIRGREQQLIDHHGRAQSEGGTSGNGDRAVSPRNKSFDTYLNEATNEFGDLQ